LKDDSYAFIFNQQGLMAGVSIEGTKISEIKRSTQTNLDPNQLSDNSAPR
jgi:lipid-binding SYLF domain-containing protein